MIKPIFLLVAILFFITGCAKTQAPFYFNLERNQNPAFIPSNKMVSAELGAGQRYEFGRTAGSLETLGYDAAAKLSLNFDSKVELFVQKLYEETRVGAKISLPTPQLMADFDLIHSAFITLGNADYSISHDNDSISSNQTRVTYTREHSSVDLAYSLGKKFGDVTIYSGLYVKQIDIVAQDKTNLPDIEQSHDAMQKGAVVGLQVPLNDKVEFGLEFNSYDLELDGIVETGLSSTTRVRFVF